LMPPLPPARCQPAWPPPPKGSTLVIGIRRHDELGRGSLARKRLRKPDALAESANS
jgi:hypothetical protein